MQLLQSAYDVERLLVGAKRIPVCRASKERAARPYHVPCACPLVQQAGCALTWGNQAGFGTLCLDKQPVKFLVNSPAHTGLPT